MHRTRQSGFTLTELIITIVVLAVLAVISVPNYVELRQRQALRGAADNFAVAVGLAKQEAVKRGEMVRVEFHKLGNGICMGAVAVADDDDDGCDCSAGACPVASFPEVSGDVGALRGVVLDGDIVFGDDGDGFVIDPRTGTMEELDATGGFGLATPSGYGIRLDVNAMARVRTCSPEGADALPGVPACA